MSNDDREKLTSKRRAESVDAADSDEEGEVERFDQKRAKISTPPAENSIDEAIKTLDRIQYELNMNNVFLDSPETSDHDTPPESEEEETEEALSQAHALGYAACIRETFRFLDSFGVSENDPIYKQLKNRFVRTTN